MFQQFLFTMRLYIILYVSGFRPTVDDRKMEAIIISLLLHNDIHINTTYFDPFGRCTNNNILRGD